MERSSIPLTGRHSVVMPEVLFTCSEGKGGAANLEEESGGFWGMGCVLWAWEEGKNSGWLAGDSVRQAGAQAGIGTTQGRTGDRAGWARKGGEWGGCVCVCVCVP